jgi:PAS domain S-box-containing protein
MYTHKGTFLLAHNSLPANPLILAGFALLLILAAAFLLYKKLKSIREEEAFADEDDDDEETAELTSSKPVISFTAAAPEPEPIPLAKPTINIHIPAAETIAVPEVKEDAATEASTVNSPPESGKNQVEAILNSLSDIIFEYDDDKVCVNLWYNKGQKLIVDLETFRGKTVSQAMGPENAQLINDALDFVAANGISTTITFQSFYGSGKWFQSHISPVFDANGEFTGHTTSLVTDITAQKKQADELKEKQLQLLEAQKIARLGDWTYDLATKQTTWSDNLFNLLEIEALPPNARHFDYYVSRVAAEDRKMVYRFFADIEGTNYPENEHKILTAKDNLRYFHIMRGQPLRDANGKIVRVTGIIQDTTEHRAIERTIKKSQAELLEAQTIAKIGNWKWNLAQKTTGWSDEVYHIYDVEPQSLQSLLGHFKLLLKCVHPEDKFILTGFLKNPADLSRTAYEYRIITRPGKLKYVSLIVAKIKNGEDGSVRSVMGTLQDVTERRKAEIDIQQTENNYQLVLETIKLAAVSLDRNGNIIFVNNYLADLLGYPQHKLIGLNWYERFISENLQPVFAKWYENNHIESNYVNPVICRDGEERVISWQHATIYDDNGQIKQTTSIGEDVTDQQKDRDLLISAKEKAERSSLFKSEFLSTMSHEIRTPMNAVIGTTNLLLDEDPRPDQLAYLNNLKFSGENLLGIIGDILDYNKIEAGKLELNKGELNIANLIANIRQTFLARAMERKIELIAEVDNRIPNNIIGDAIRVGQILNNLISNAIKFTHKGSVTLLARQEARDEKHVKIHFTVADTGIGIDQKNLDRIFEPFVQEAQHRNYGGTGLGLAIIKRLVELHGSDIKVSSILGKGTQFKFIIEFEYSAEPLKPKLNQLQKMQEGDLTGMKVLVVDDNKMNILIASRFLNKWNISYSEANNGLVATEMVDKIEFDLVLMDLQMPVMDGFEATTIIKEKYPDLPIIALTADAMPETFIRTVNCGMDDYLTKPFMPEILFEKVSKHYKIAMV